MLTIVLVLVQVIVTSYGIYVFDYLVNQQVDSILVILLSIVLGTIMMLLVLAFYIEFFYFVIAKRKPQTSMLKHKIAKQMVSIPLHLTNCRIKIIGKENLPKDPGFSIYANHTSLMDIPVLMYKLYEYPVAFLQKEVVSGLFSVGKWTPTLGCVNIDRSNDRKGAESIIQVIRNVKSGSTMVVFPEGTRSKQLGKLLPFKDGSFKVALKSKAPLVPITIQKPKNYKSIKWPFVKRITLVVHKPLLFEDIKQLKTQELSEKVKSIIESAL